MVVGGSATDGGSYQPEWGPSTITRVTELAFVLASRQNHFFVELVEAIRDELQVLGVRSRVVTDGFPPPRRGLVCVLVPPHEYFALRGVREPPCAALLRRAVFVCAEQPASHFFERNVTLAAEAGAVFDISRRAVNEWRRRGVDAEQFQLGYTARWDRSPFDGERDIEVAFLGSRSPRRERFLAGYAPSLWQRRSYLLLSDNSSPNHHAGPDFAVGDAKRDLLARSRVLLNLHVDDEPYCETLRIVEAIHCGAVVVSEHSVDAAPLEPGIDFMSASADNLMLVAGRMLDDADARRAFADSALARLRAEVPLRASVERLVVRAEEVDRGASVLAPTPVRLTDGESDEPSFELPQPSPSSPDPEQATLRRAVKQVKLDLLAAKRDMDRLRDMLSHDGSADVSVVASTPAYGPASPRISVIVSLYDYEDHIEAALGSAARSELRSFELIVVDDASTDDSRGRVLDWCERHPDIATLVIAHRLNRGLPHARNTGLDFARGELAFILDADNEVYPHCLSRLVEALDQNPNAVFAWGMADRFDSDGPINLLSVGGWDPVRFRHSNYVDAMAMIRCDRLRELDGYTTDMRLHGWEDYDLWCKVAERGWRGHAVREIVGRYRVSTRSMLATTTGISGTDAYVALIERHPRLMAGVKPPD